MINGWQYAKDGECRAGERPDLVWPMEKGGRFPAWPQLLPHKKYFSGCATSTRLGDLTKANKRCGHLGGTRTPKAELRRLGAIQLAQGVIELMLHLFEPSYYNYCSATNWKNMITPEGLEPPKSSLEGSKSSG